MAKFINVVDARNNVFSQTQRKCVEVYRAAKFKYEVHMERIYYLHTCMLNNMHNIHILNNMH